MRYSFVGIVALLLNACDITEGTVHEKIHEPTISWWTDERECTDWETYITMCISFDGQLFPCTDTRCAHWNPYRQEHIDDEDFILNVLGEDAWGDLKMRRVYVPRATWEGIPVGMPWTNEEIPDLGDDHKLGDREG